MTEDSSQLLHWMVCGPEVARCVSEFEASLPYNRESLLNHQTRHHEQTDSMQRRFSKHVISLISAFEEAGNPFLEESEDLIALDSRDIAIDGAIDVLRNVEEIGEKQFQDFLGDRLKSTKKSLFDPIKQNKLYVFNRPTTRKATPHSNEISTLKKSCQLFSQLYIACQVRDGNIDEFFRHENNSYPPSISKNGCLRSGTKSDLVRCLVDSHSIDTEQNDIIVECIILDGAAIANMIKPKNVNTFQGYADQNFVPHIRSHLQKCKRIDLVWDVYIEHSLKSSARQKRGMK